MAQTRVFNLSADKWQLIAKGGPSVSIRTRAAIDDLLVYVGPDELGAEGTSEALPVSKFGVALRGVGDNDHVYVKASQPAHVYVGQGLDVIPMRRPD